MKPTTVAVPPKCWRSMPCASGSWALSRCCRPYASGSDAGVACRGTAVDAWPTLPVAETPDIYRAWKAGVAEIEVIGKHVHYARLVAVCQVHAVTHVLTFNVSHFARLAGFGPGVVVVDPASV